MDKKLDYLISLTEENNKLLKKIDNELNQMKTSTTKMDHHIDNIMTIYQGYKAPLDYVSNAFTFSFFNTKELENKKEIENKKEDL